MHQRNVSLCSNRTFMELKLFKERFDPHDWGF